MKKTNVKFAPKRIENIFKKLSKLEIRFDKSLKNVNKIDNNVKGLISETRTIKSVQSDLNRMWDYSHDLAQRLNYTNGKMNSLTRKNTLMWQKWENDVKNIHDIIGKFEANLNNVIKLPKFYENVNEKVSELEKQYNHIASDVMNKIKDLEDTIRPEEEKMHKIVDLDVVKDQVDGIRKSMLTFNKLWDDYKRTIDERLGLRPTVQATTMTTGGISSKLEGEVKSLRDMTNRLSLENDQIKNMARDIKVTQLGTPNTGLVTDLTSRINTVEKKMTEVEEGLSKFVKDKPVVME